MNESYLDAFIGEAEESIVELNNALLALEDDPDDDEAMDRIFRTAHTLKGNCSAMGFEEPSRLAHAIEDLLDAVRNGQVAVTPAVMDPIFDGVDLIEAAIDEVEASDGEGASIEPDPVIDELRAVLDGEAADLDEDADPDDGSDAPSDVLAAVDPGVVADAERPLVDVQVDLDGGDMPAIDGTLLVERATESLELLGSVPPTDAICDGDYDGGVHLLVAGSDPADAEAAVGDVGPVVDAAATDVTGDVPPDGDPDGDEEPTADAVDDVKSVRIDVEQLDTLYGLVEQLVTSRIKLRRAIDEGDVEAAADPMDGLDKISANLQRTVMDMRMIPLDRVVGNFPRMVRDIAREQGKEVDFAMENTDVELDRTILDEVSDPLLHLLRNAVDHGIEPPAEREEAGKPEEGTIRLRAERLRDSVRIEVEDDGGGLDVAALEEQALAHDIASEAELAAMDDAEIYELIFHPGFSTSAEVTDVSGRGVGMDVVASTVNRLDGTVSVESTPGEGTTIAIQLPISVAIDRVLFVEVAGNEYGIPIKVIDEIADSARTETINGTETIDHDGSVYPLVRLREEFGASERLDPGDSMLLRVRDGGTSLGLLCDAVHRIDEVVIKPLEGQLRDVPGLGGTAVVGDGNVVPIIDVRSLG